MYEYMRICTYILIASILDWIIGYFLFGANTDKLLWISLASKHVVHIATEYIAGVELFIIEYA